eukprot:209538-Rhodomonas_salina.1
MRGIYRRGIVHRDIKPQNILLIPAPPPKKEKKKRTCHEMPFVRAPIVLCEHCAMSGTCVRHGGTALRNQMLLTAGLIRDGGRQLTCEASRLRVSSY